VEGRDITWEDGPKSQKVVLINETVARRLWPGEDPVGKTANASGTDVLVVGVVADVRETNAEEGAGWQMYLPAAQFGPDGAQLVVRTKLPPEVLASSVMTTLRQINPGQPAVEFRTIQRLVDHATSPRRFFVVLVSIFAALGLLLAALGIYGVISYSVTQKTQEIGIRMALGATQGRVQRYVLGKTLRMALVGTVVGVVASVGVSRLIATLLFGTAPTDVVTFAGMVVVLGAVAFVAGYVPARRASRIEPSIALRSA
jgi:ABC-type antimicrobial peptide transport system permease subunit